MLVNIELDNFLLFEHAVFEFTGGLNAVSGETGAGKSLVARALGLALGGRGGQDAIRAGCDEAVIQAAFAVGKTVPPEARALADGKGRVAVRRTIRRDGGGGIAVNGRAATAQTVRNSLAGLVDFAAQNEHMRLGDTAYQLELLDAHGKLGGDAAAFADAFRAAESLAKRLNAGQREKELARLRLERARSDLADLERIGFDPARDPGLEDEIREAANAAGIVRAAADAAELLQAGEPSATERLAAAWKSLEKLAPVSPRLAEAAAEIEAALEHTEEGLAKLAGLADDLDAGPEKLDRMIERSEHLKRLAKRLDCDVPGLAKAREALEAEIEDLSGGDAGEDELRRRLASALPAVAKAGLALGKKRRDAAARLAKAVNKELAGLGMEQAGFSVQFDPLWTEAMPPEDILNTGSRGLDEVAFFLSPNPGEAPAAVSGGASGGEASRAVLALKAALSDVYRPDVMFLDEVDAGVGSRLGRELGEKLEALAATRQVIVITHLPQIAACAERHLKVSKAVRKNRTAARVDTLAGDARVREIASMIHGSAANELTILQAREMLETGTGSKGRTA